METRYGNLDPASWPLQPMGTGDAAESCANCALFAWLLDHKTRGFCFRNPVTLSKAASDWCGEWTKKK